MSLSYTYTLGTGLSPTEHVQGEPYMIQLIITSPQKKRLVRIENGDGEETNQVDEGFGKDGYLYSVSKTL